MKHRVRVGLVIASLSAIVCCSVLAQEATPAPAPSYTDDGRLQRPQDYREWIYLSSGLDMSYRERSDAPTHSMFDNVFAKPDAYRAFLRSGTWPDKTVLVMEARGASNKGSINKAGHFQSGEVMGMEVHVKDSARFGGGWAFFSFDGAAPAKRIPEQAACYTCHRDHGAVDTTFVQFYPTLLDIATKSGTLSVSYLKEAAAADLGPHAAP